MAPGAFSTSCVCSDPKITAVSKPNENPPRAAERDFGQDLFATVGVDLYDWVVHKNIQFDLVFLEKRFFCCDHPQKRPSVFGGETFAVKVAHKVLHTGILGAVGVGQIGKALVKIQLGKELLLRVIESDSDFLVKGVRIYSIRRVVVFQKFSGRWYKRQSGDFTSQ